MEIAHVCHLYWSWCTAPGWCVESNQMSFMKSSCHQRTEAELCGPCQSNSNKQAASKTHFQVLMNYEAEAWLCLTLGCWLWVIGHLSLLQRVSSRWGCQVLPDNRASILLLNLLPGLSRLQEATQKEQQSQILDKVLTLAQPFFHVWPRQSLRGLSFLFYPFKDVWNNH